MFSIRDDAILFQREREPPDCSSHGILTALPKSKRNARLKSRRDCKCPCHHGGIAMHFVPCCDEKLGFLRRRRPSAKRAGTKLRKKSKRTGTGLQRDQPRSEKPH